jgi:hypothetical protein
MLLRAHGRLSIAGLIFDTCTHKDFIYRELKMKNFYIGNYYYRKKFEFLN